MEDKIYAPVQTLLMNTKCSCWYCNRRLAEARRFCDKVCAEAFEEDEMAMERHMLAAKVEAGGSLIAQRA